MHLYTNRLAQESSPYLLQHAHNPVDWFPYSEEAFEKAKQENKPVLVSIGYAACHWCHVMENESFEDEQVAAIMNEHFVNIKVDREERPDVDHIYMDAVQAISGSGGWPLNVFLTPDRKPFYGGTYFPPQRAFNRASWTEVLLSVSQAYKEKKEEIEQQAHNLTEHLKVSNAFGVNTSLQSQSVFDEKKMAEGFQNIMKLADREWGGFGKAPKFPQTFTINFLLAFSHVYKNEEALQQALLSLDKMAQGGLYDHIGGGFARYSTDTEWLVPHFEKMLYDNALLVVSFAEAYQLTGNPLYKQVIEQTLSFIERELMDEQGGFYSALDADSEGEEGKYYVWNYEEVKELLNDDAELFCSYFDITSNGNWEEKNIPWVQTPLNQFTIQKHIEPEVLKRIIQIGREKLLQQRDRRIRPLLDDKVLLGWNALMNMAYAKAFAVTGSQHYKTVAERNMNFLLQSFKNMDGSYYHTWKNGTAKHPAFLDDYANLIAALIELAQVTSDFTFLDRAKQLTEWVISSFSDEESSLFYYTSHRQTDILLRKKEVYDGATPSGNAVMAQNLYRLSILFNQSSWRQRAEGMVNALGEAIVKYPTSFGVWLSILFEIIKGTNEIAVVGKKWENHLEKILCIYIPHKLIMATAEALKTYPLLADKAQSRETLIYLCRNYVCLRPVNSVEDLQGLL
ncbi:MAG: thioredoxin domain-containing protein [Flavisolibacter sp.]